jgi:hypothetical protein
MSSALTLEQWNEISINPQVLLQCWGAGHSFLILRDTILDFAKNILPPLEPKLLVMLGRIVKRCKLFMKCCKLSSINSTGARECAAHHGMALEHFSANW